jgi:hypothetical protein
MSEDKGNQPLTNKHASIAMPTAYIAGALTQKNLLMPLSSLSDATRRVDVTPEIRRIIHVIWLDFNLRDYLEQTTQGS